MNTKRVRLLNSNKYTTGHIVYWMSRDQRVHDNWALIYALEQAKLHNTYVEVIFCLRETFEHNTERMVDFMVEGLKEVSKELAAKNIPFQFLIGDPALKIVEYITKENVGMLISDFNPLRWHTNWKNTIAKNITIPLSDVDAHNLVPVWEASPKQEFGAYTIRPKLASKRKEFLEFFPVIQKQNVISKKISVDWNDITKKIKKDRTVPTVDWLLPGEKEALKTLDSFIENRLPIYDTDRNDPTKNAQSLLSPYVHFGHIGAQTIALKLQTIKNMQKQKDAFLEELLVRKELSDNYCFYNENYDNPDGFPEWAKLSISKHQEDLRMFLYTTEQLEFAKTEDPLWNAAQKEMLHKGKMHGYMRMYWAKKILEWSKSVLEAQKIAIYLNDKYFLDGRDPNGYTGIAWSMGGVHDRAWFERPIFGKIRYMNYNGAKSKFDVMKYISMQELND